MGNRKTAIAGAIATLLFASTMGMAGTADDESNLVTPWETEETSNRPDWVAVEMQWWDSATQTAWRSAPEPYTPHEGPVEETLTNILKVDQTGEIISWIDRDAQLTDIHILGMEPGSTGYTLIDPYGYAIWQNKSANVDGVVEFWYVELVVGEYHVYQNASVHGTEESQQALVAIPLTEALDLIGCDLPLHTVPDCEEKATTTSSPYCTREVGRERLWTPLIIVNAPYMGEAEAHWSWSESTGVYALPFGYTSSSNTGVEVNTVNGETRGYFRLAEWGMYELFYPDPMYGCGLMTPGNYQGETAKVISWKMPDGSFKQRTFELWKYRSTDKYDATDVSYDGYESVTFDPRFHSKDDEESLEDPSKPIRRSTEGEELRRIGGAISISSYEVGFEALSFQKEHTSGTGYTYTFRDYDGIWQIDYQDAQYSGYAFNACSSAQWC